MGQYYYPINIDRKEYVYSHDYGNGLKLMEHSWIGNNFVGTVMNLLRKGGNWFKNHIVWSGDYADNEPGTEKNLQSIMDDEGTKINPPVSEAEGLRYLKNIDKNEFVDLKKVPAVKYAWTSDAWQIHPLPLLTCEGNGRGGGDFHGGKDELIGIWARNRIVAQKSKPKNCKEIIFDLVEK